MARGKLSWTLTEGIPGAEPPGGVRALTSEQISVVFQPIVEVATGQAMAMEALVRCKDPRYPNPPALFEAAVQEEACGRLGRLIRDVAFATCGPRALFVNLHPQELASRWLVKPDDPIGFHDHAVYLEITETVAFTHFDLCMGVLKELCRRTGAHLVVDDFGAGYSNLERVADLAPDVVKLDLALTRGIERHKAKQVVVRHMVQMCKELGALVVGEGVETLDELKCLRDLGAEYVQGYLLARPAAPPPAHVWPLEESAAVTLPPAAPRRQPPPLPPRKPPLPPPLKRRDTGSVRKAPPKRTSKPPTR
jgi:EAL domain-containing protein (putative c-di-GMP-specific phosphodiesterase class I)